MLFYAQNVQQEEPGKATSKTTVEFNKLRPDATMPAGLYGSAEFQAFYNANQHLNKEAYVVAFQNFVYPAEKDPKPVFENTGNPEQDRTNYQLAKMEWLKKNSPIDYWREQDNNTQNKRK